MKPDIALAQALNEALNALFPEHGIAEPEKLIQLQKTKKEFEGDLTLVVFPLTRYIKQNPEQLARQIGEYLLKESPLVSAFNVVKGFLNLSLHDEVWAKLLQTALDERYGQAPEASGKLYLVEYSSPNTNKPLHLGHLRNNFLGHSVSRIFEANGHQVVKVQVINDRGIHICKSMLAWEKFGNGETPESSGLKGDKLVGKYYVEFDRQYRTEIQKLVEQGRSAEEAAAESVLMQEAQEMLRRWEAGDTHVVALWKKMNAWVYEGFNETYHTIGVDFDKLYYESDTYLLGKEMVAEGLEKGVFFSKDDGSVWCDLSDEGLDQKLLLRADGTSVYITQDLGTALLRLRDYPALNGMVYTVGNEQDYHFKVLFSLLKKLGYAWADECHHLSYGMVDLPSGKMKSREGTVVDADDLVQEMVEESRKITEELGKANDLSEAGRKELYETLALGALKYFILKVDPKKRMLFNPAESIDFQGNTGPFLQYAYARVQSLLRKAPAVDTGFSASVALEPAVKEVIRVIADYPAAVREAAASYSPAVIANYVYELVRQFNHFYQSVPVLKEENEEKLRLKLALCKATGQIVASGLYLLGMRVPERM